jgi:ATP synthase I chain
VFAHFELPNIPDVARRTVSMALVVGVAALVAAVSFGNVLVGLGACIGLGLGTFNFRMIGNSVAKVSASDVENKKKPLALNTLGRLGIITVVAIGLMLVSHSLGWGVFGGLFAFQVILLTNAARSMAKGGPMASVDGVVTANVIEDDTPPIPPALGPDSTGGS